MEQISIFNRTPPRIDYYYNKDERVFCQTQGHIYCAVCGKFLGCTGLYSWRLSNDEVQEFSREEQILKPFHNIDGFGFCSCGAFVGGVGGINNGIKGEI